MLHTSTHMYLTNDKCNAYLLFWWASAGTGVHDLIVNSGPASLLTAADIWSTKENINQNQGSPLIKAVIEEEVNAPNPLYIHVQLVDAHKAVAQAKFNTGSMRD